MTIVGYARTSTVEQEAGLEAQLEALKAAGVERVYSEQVSSVADVRPQLEAALGWVREGDVFVVTKIDRLARSAVQLLELIDDLKRQGVVVRILDFGMDTGTPVGRFTLTVLGAMAEMERTQMLDRQRAGIEKAKSEGKYKGRAPTAQRQLAEILALRGRGMGDTAIALALGISRMSVWRVRTGK